MEGSGEGLEGSGEGLFEASGTLSVAQGVEGSGEGSFEASGMLSEAQEEALSTGLSESEGSEESCKEELSEDARSSR